MSDIRKTKHGHSVERKAPGQFTITLDKRAGSLGIGSANDPYLICEMMALDALLGETHKADALDKTLAEEDDGEEPPKPDGTRETHLRIREWHIARTSASRRDYEAACFNEAITPRSDWTPHRERVLARRHMRERAAERHAMNDETPSAFERVTKRIRAFSEVIREIAAGAIERSR
jgi:hypothetical protein